MLSVEIPGLRIRIGSVYSDFVDVDLDTYHIQIKVYYYCENLETEDVVGRIIKNFIPLGKGVFCPSCGAGSGRGCRSLPRTPGRNEASGPPRV